MKGGRLFNTLATIRAALELEFERVDKLKHEFQATQNEVNDHKKETQMLEGIIPDVDPEGELSKELSRKQSTLTKSEYPCIRLEQTYETAVMKNWPEFSFETLVNNNISFFEYINTSRYFNSYNYPIEED